MRNLINDKLFLLLITILPLMGFSQADIPIDGYLKDNSEMWKVKTKQKGFMRYKPAAIFFGPVKTIQTDAEKAQQLSRDVSRDLFWKDIKTVNSMESSILLTFNDTDTAVINMLTVTIDEIHKRNTTGVIFKADKNEDEILSSSTWADEMIIRFQNDTTEWHYTKMDSTSLVLAGYIGKLHSEKDSFFVKPVDNMSGKKMKDIMFSQPATGFIFLHEGKQVAAMQLIMKRSAWISKEIGPAAKEAILATMAGLFATIKAENGEGF